MKKERRENFDWRKNLGGFVETTKEFNKLDEVNDAEGIIKMKKIVFEVWLTMIFMRGSDKRKYG